MDRGAATFKLVATVGLPNREDPKTFGSKLTKAESGPPPVVPIRAQGTLAPFIFASTSPACSAGNVTM